jgi:hypothetical protein
MVRVNTIFISHASEDAALATALEQVIGPVLGESVTISSSTSRSSRAKVPGGDEWRRWILTQARSASATVVVLTPQSIYNHWVLWETGAVSGAAVARDQPPKLIPVCFDLQPEQLPKQFEHIQAIDGLDLDAIAGLLRTLIREVLPEAQRDRASERLGATRPTRDEYHRAVSSRKPPPLLSDSTNALRRALDTGFLADSAFDRTVLSLAYAQYLDRVSDRIVSWPGRPLVVPSSEYPHYLIRFQQDLSARVDALAFVDDVERFWARRLGQEILAGSALGRTRRVFVFRTERDLKDYSGILLEHGARYDVRVASADSIRSRFPHFARDFSLISTSDDDRVLARYVNDRNDIGIEFTRNVVDAGIHTRVFEQIWSTAFTIPVEREFDGFAQAVFDIERVEMSRYIELEKYDQHEEKHPYFVEMMEKMIAVYQEHRPPGFCKLLEMGAGTGHFTKRLVNELGARGKLTAVEFDSNCFRLMLSKPGLMSQSDRCEILNEESRSYDPVGKFDFVFSSFADHHIVSSEKEADEYFLNIRRNLHARSSFIVGDEFLPEHKRLDEAARARAVRAYHDHIIEVATATREAAPADERAGFECLIALERQAMESGLTRTGDFKVSVSHYLERLERNGLRYDTPMPTGPLAADVRERVGGIYVIRAWLAE